MLLCAAMPARAQVQEASPPRWDTETVRQMLRDIEAARNTAVAARAQKDAAAPVPVVATPAIKTAPQKAQMAIGPLLGLSAATITAKLGSASFTRTDGKAQLLQFARQPCVLDVFLYAGLSRYIEARSSSGASFESDACLRKQLASRGLSLPDQAAPVPSLPLPAPPLTDLPATASPSR
jgi:hypothetical protein